MILFMEGLDFMVNRLGKLILALLMTLSLILVCRAAELEPPSDGVVYLRVSWAEWKNTYWESKLIDANVTLTNVYDSSISYTSKAATFETGSYSSNWLQTGIPQGYYDMHISYSRNGTTYEHTKHNLLINNSLITSCSINRDEEPLTIYYAYDGADNDPAGHGDILIDAHGAAGNHTYDYCPAGETVKVTVRADEGWRLKNLGYSDKAVIFWKDSFDQTQKSVFGSSQAYTQLDFAYAGVKNGLDTYTAEFLMPAKNISIYAEYEQIPVSCTLTFDVQLAEVENAPEPEEVAYGSLADYPMPAPACEGYVFRGWFKDEDCSNDKEWSFSEDTVTEDTTLYAKWNKLCTVTFLDSEGELWDEYLNVEAETKIEPSETEPDREGYLFTAWFMDEDCLEADRWDFDNFAVMDDMTLYPGWVKSWTVRFLDYEGNIIDAYEVEDGKTSPEPQAPEREGYTFTGWDTDFSSVTEPLDINPEYEINRYTVTFLDWDESILKIQENVPYSMAATAPASPSRAGYRFSGWDKSFNDITSDLTVKAQYVLTHTVTFDWEGVEAQIVNHGGRAEEPSPQPARTGYILTGWTYEGQPWSFTQDTVLTDILLAPVWAVYYEPAAEAKTPVKITEKTEGGEATISASAGAVLSTDTASALIKKAAEAEGKGQRAVVEIKMEPAKNTDKAELSIPKESFKKLAEETDADLVIDCSVGSLSFEAEALKGIAALEGAVTVSLEKLDADKLTEEVRQTIGGRPVYNFEVRAGETTVSEFRGSITVSLPYELAEGEDKNSIVVYYLGSGRKLETVRGAYDEKTGCVVFRTGHFSSYVVGYNKVDFTDTGKDAPYYDAVSFIAARGISRGTGQGCFSPELSLSRGQFITLLLRAYGIKEAEPDKDGFSDTGSTYYSGYIEAARQLNISSGTGDNRFSPERSLSRQEAYTMVYKLLKALKELDKSDAVELRSYADYDTTADWAREAYAYLLGIGLLDKAAGLEPLEVMSRADMAMLLYKLLG
jgi:uncharacterized repeat protein (TIGR02543 family)